MDAKGALKGITVIDTSQALAGPYCTMMLGDLGAEVIKMERPGIGDQSRGWGPPFLEGESAYFLSINRNKRGITLDLKSAEGRDIMRRLIKRADVFVVNIPRIESLRKLQIDYETLRAINLRLIYCSISGYGMRGPKAGRGSYDFIAQGESGVMSITGEPDGGPVRYPVPIADITTGIYGALGIIAALLARERTGEGQYIDMSLIESQIASLTSVSGAYFTTDQRPQPVGNDHPHVVPYQLFKAKDKYLIIAVGTEGLWKAFCRILDIEDTVMNDPRFATNADRNRNRAELIPILERIIAREEAEIWLERFLKAGIPCGPINYVDEILNDPHILERGAIVQLEHPLIGIVKSIGNPVHLSATPVSYRRPPPLLGQHNEEVLSWLGYAPDEIEVFKERGVI